MHWIPFTLWNVNAQIRLLIWSRSAMFLIFIVLALLISFPVSCTLITGIKKSHVIMIFFFFFFCTCGNMIFTNSNWNGGRCLIIMVVAYVHGNNYTFRGDERQNYFSSFRKVANLLPCRKRRDVGIRSKLRSHFASRITKTRLFKYKDNFTSKNWIFSDKKLWYF